MDGPNSLQNDIQVPISGPTKFFLKQAVDPKVFSDRKKNKNNVKTINSDEMKT